MKQGREAVEEKSLQGSQVRPVKEVTFELRHEGVSYSRAMQRVF